MTACGYLAGVITFHGVYVAYLPSSREYNFTIMYLPDGVMDLEQTAVTCSIIVSNVLCDFLYPF